MSERATLTILYVLSLILLVLAAGMVAWPATRLVGLPLIAVSLACLVVASEIRKKMKNG
jgi:uncharacterized membrane protein